MSCRLLDGIRILDLTMVYAGPFGTRILGELGAEVIKIETAQRPDVFTRANDYPENEPGEEPWNQGGLFHALNSGKYGCTLNISSEKGKDIFKRIVEISDVVAENFSPRVMDNWGLGYEVLRRINPQIIMVSMSGLGHSGPRRDYSMYMTGMESYCGLANLTGYPDDAPLVSNFAYGDWVDGASGVAALLIALYYRQRSGKGCYIDVSGVEAITCHIGEVIMDYTLNSRDQTRMGNQHSSMVPHGCYQCKGDDEWINITIENDEQWKGFCEAMGNPAWTKDEKFSDSLSRWQNRKELDKLVEEWTRGFDHYEAMEILQRAKVVAGAALTMKEFYLNPHLRERGFFQLIDHGEGVGKRPIPQQMPIKFSDVETFIPKRAPRFGEDNEYVFCKLLGIPKEELAKLEEEKVIGGVPSFPLGRGVRKDLIDKQEAAWFDPNYLEELRKVYGEDIARK